MVGMRWEESVLALFEDLEQQAAGLHLEARDAEVHQLSQVEYSAVSWASRLYASRGAQVTLRLWRGQPLRGRLARVGDDWLLLQDEVGSEWVVCFAAVATVAGVSSRSVSEAARSVLTRLPLRSVLRRFAEARDDCVVHLRDGGSVEGRLGRVGVDFVEAHPIQEGRRRSSEPALIRLDAIAMIQGRP